MKRYFLLLLLFTSSIVCAQQPSITLSVEDTINEQQADGSQRPAMQPGQSFTIVATLKNTTNKHVSNVVGLDQFDLIGHEIRDSEGFSNGHVYTQQIQKFTVKTDKEGVFTFGPLKLQHQGNTIESNTISIRVGKDVRPADGTQQSAANDHGSVLCKIKVDKQTACVGEPIVATVTFYVDNTVLELRHDNPSFPNFAIKPIKQSIKKEVPVDGKTYFAQEHKVVLIPLKEGIKGIGPIRIVYAVQRQINQQRKYRNVVEAALSALGHHYEEIQTQSNGVRITILPTPTNVGPIDSVGSFTGFTASVNKQEAIINEAITLTLTLEGKADFEHIPTLKLNLPDGFKYYESKNSIDEDLNTDYTGGKKHFEYVVQATNIGSQAIPPQEFKFYDVGTKTVKSIKTNPITLTIKQGEGTPPQHIASPSQVVPQPSPSVEKKQTPTIKDINFIVDDAPIHKQKPWSLPWWLFIILLIVPAMVLQKNIAAFLQTIVRVIFKQGSRKNISSFEKKLDSIIKRNDSCALHQFFLQFLATKYALPIQQVTEDWIEQQLLQSGWHNDKVNEFMEYMGNCAQLTFTTHKASGINHDMLLKKAQYWFLILNNSRGI